MRQTFMGRWSWLVLWRILSIQVILNIAVVTNTIPNTGISLPFISYGGTSVLFLLAEMGLALSVAKGIQFEVN